MNAGMIERARRRQEEAAGVRGEALPLQGADGVRHMQVDSELYHKTRIQNQREYGVDDCWREEEFCRDMKKRHPEIRVKTISRTPRIGGKGTSRGIGRMIPGIGQVTFHKRYK